MTYDYKLIASIFDPTEIVSVNKIYENGALCCIPFCPGNTDYEEYLEWLEEGNTPLPADE